MKCGCEVEVQSVKFGTSSVTFGTAQRFRTKHARSGLRGARCMQILSMKKVLCKNLKATSGPPGAGTIGICARVFFGNFWTFFVDFGEVW